MNYAQRVPIYRQIEADRKSKVIAFVTSDRPGMETQIAADCVALWVDLLDQIGPTQKISLILHTNGGQTSTAWRLINLLRTFCDDLEILVPFKAMSAGTLMCLGADRIVMTKQAVLGPIDPSVTHPLGPNPVGNPGVRVPVSVEAVRGYLDAAKSFGVLESSDVAQVLVDLSNKVHPLVLGEIFRSRAQIRSLADKLIRRQVQDEKHIQELIDFLCADSGSHDYTMNRREAKTLGLNVEIPTAELYKLLYQTYHSYARELKLLETFSTEVILGAQATANYIVVRGLVETTDGGCYGFTSEGRLMRVQVPVPGAGIMQDAISDQRTFEGWKSL